MKNLFAGSRSLRGVLAAGALLLVLPLTSVLNPAKAAPTSVYRRTTRRTYTRPYVRPRTHRSYSTTRVYRRPGYNGSYTTNRTIRRYTPGRTYTHHYSNGHRVYGTYVR